MTKKATQAISTDDLLAMEENCYMNNQQLNYFKELLTQEQSQLLELIALPTNGVLEECESVADPLDRATAESERQASHRQRALDESRLAEVKKALQRIDSGDFGFCTMTGEPIGLRRLLARPTANLTIEAQERYEKQAHLLARAA